MVEIGPPCLEGSGTPEMTWDLLAPQLSDLITARDVVLQHDPRGRGHLNCRGLAPRAAGSADELVAVHWRHPVADYPLTGDEVHDQLRVSAEQAGLRCVVAHRESDLRVEVWARDDRSVAARSGLVAP